MIRKTQASSNRTRSAPHGASTWDGSEWPPPIPAPLADALAYRNDIVVYKFMEGFDVSFSEAERLFTETRRWLWLCAIGPHVEGAPLLVITGPLLMLDEMWHTFVLFTREYSQFCKQYLGRYIHHLPMTKTEKDAKAAAYAANFALQRRKDQASLKRMLSFIYDQLGEAVVKRWYVDFSTRYSVDNMNQLRLPLGGRKPLLPATDAVGPAETSA